MGWKENWRQLPKRILASGLALSMIGGSLDLTALEVSAETMDQQVTITAIEPLADEIGVQQLAVGASENEIVFPDTLQATVMYAVDQPADASGVTEETDYAADEAPASATEQITLSGVTWTIDAAQSDAAVFDSSEESNGACYVYTPILPQTDDSGRLLVMGADVELPAIYVLVGEPQTALLAEGDVAEVTVGNGTPTTYQTVSGALEAIQTAINDATGNVDITLKFLADETVTGLVHSLNGNGKNVSLTIDMNGKTVGINWENGGKEKDFQLEMTDIKVSLTGGGTLSAAAYIKEKAALEVKGEADINLNGTLYIEDGGTATLNKLRNDFDDSNVEISAGSSCEIKGEHTNKYM